MTADAAGFLLRLYLEKRDPAFKPALDQAIQFVLDSQYPIGAWPQRWPQPPRAGGPPHYSSYYTFNDDVAGANIELLLQCYEALGERRLLDPIVRGMRAFLATQQPAPRAGWALQYTPDLRPAAARSYEPRALATHVTARKLELLLEFYRLTGDEAFLTRIPEALDWLDRVALPAGGAGAPGRTHPTFIEIGTDRPLSSTAGGATSPTATTSSITRRAGRSATTAPSGASDTPGLRRRYQQARALDPAALRTASPLAPGARPRSLPRLVAVDAGAAGSPEAVVAALNAQGYWPARLGRTSHPFTRHGSARVAPGDYPGTHVGDETDTSPFPDTTTMGLTITSFIRNMSVPLQRVPEDRRAGAAARLR